MSVQKNIRLLYLLIDYFLLISFLFVFLRASDSLISFDDEQPVPSQAPTVSNVTSKMQALSK